MRQIRAPTPAARQDDAVHRLILACLRKVSRLEDLRPFSRSTPRCFLATRGADAGLERHWPLRALCGIPRIKCRLCRLVQVSQVLHGRRPTRLRRSRLRRLVLQAFPLAIAMAGMMVADCVARDHVDGLDAKEPQIVPSFDRGAARLLRHARTAEVRHEGRAAELFDFEINAPVTVVKLAYPHPPAVLIDDLSLTLWFLSNQNGATLSAQVTFPHQIDPATGK